MFCKNLGRYRLKLIFNSKIRYKSVIEQKLILELHLCVYKASMNNLNFYCWILTKILVSFSMMEISGELVQPPLWFSIVLYKSFYYIMIKTSTAFFIQIYNCYAINLNICFRKSFSETLKSVQSFKGIISKIIISYYFNILWGCSIKLD